MEVMTDMFTLAELPFNPDTNERGLTVQQVNLLLGMIHEFEEIENGEEYPEDHWHWSGQRVTLLWENSYMNVIFSDDSLWWINQSFLQTYLHE
jgi:hypothetical protein